MKYNLRTADFDFEKGPTKYYIYFDDAAEIVCGFELVERGQYAGLYMIVSTTRGGKQIGKFNLRHWDIHYGVWDRENLLPYLMTHHIEDLMKFEIGYWEDLEPVELPEHFTE